MVYKSFCTVVKYLGRKNHCRQSALAANTHHLLTRWLDPEAPPAGIPETSMQSLKERRLDSTWSNRMIKHNNQKHNTKLFVMEYTLSSPELVVFNHSLKMSGRFSLTPSPSRHLGLTSITLRCLHIHSIKIEWAI